MSSSVMAMRSSGSPEKTEASSSGETLATEYSPTRVSDFDSSVEHDEDPEAEEREGEDESRPLKNCPHSIPHQALQPPHLTMMTTSLYHKPRNLFLATLEETSSVSSAESGVIRERRTVKEVKESRSDESKEKEQVIAPSYPRRGSSRFEKPSSREARAHDEVAKLKQTANKQASRGKEKDALKTYNRSLKVMRSELSRIKKQLEYAGETPSLTARLIHSWEHVASAIAEIRTVMAVLYERLGDYEKAIKSCKEAREVYSSYAHLTEKGGNLRLDIKGHMEQMDLMLSRLATARDSFMDRKSMHEEVIQIRHRMQNANDKQKKAKLREDVIRVLRQVLDRECKSLGEGHPQVADTLTTLARVYADGGELDVAIDEQEAAVSILRLALGKLHPRTAVATRELGKLFDRRKRNEADLHEAVTLYTEAVASFREAYGDQNGMVGATLNDLAVIHIRRKEYDNAMALLSDALISYESLESSNGLSPDAAQVWKNLGECYCLRRDWESALLAYTSALRVQQDARRAFESNNTTGAKPSKSPAHSLGGIDDPSLADTLSRLGRATASLKKYDEAAQSHEEALAIYRKMLEDATKRAKGRMCPQIVTAQDKIAHTLYCIAEVKEKNGNYDQASALYSEALELRLNSDAGRDDQRMNMVHCAMNLAGIGSVHMRKGEFTDACMVLKESLKFLDAHGVPNDHEIYGIIRDRLLAAERGFLASPSFSDEDTLQSKSSKEDKTLALDQTALQQMDEGDYDGAMRTLTTALAIRRKRLTKRRKKHPAESCTKEKNDVARTLGTFATVLLTKGEKRQAESLYEEALRIYRSNGMSDDAPPIQAILKQMAEART